MYYTQREKVTLALLLALALALIASLIWLAGRKPHEMPSRRIIPSTHGSDEGVRFG